MTVLILTAHDDDTAARVDQEITRRGHAALRLDLGDFPESVTLSLSGPVFGWSGRLTVDDVELPLASVTSVYYRRPSSFRLPRHLTASHRRFATAEARQTWGGALSCLQVPFVNRPAKIAAAELKPAQLVAAAEAGFRVPRTMITNVGRDARDFVRATTQVVYKPLSAPFLRDGEDATLVYATLVGVDDLDDESIAVAPCQLQEFVPKRHDVRLTAVGSRCFAAAIRAGSDRAYVDWRADYSALSYEVIVPPRPVAEAVHRYLTSFGLSFGCFDFSVGPGPDGPDTWWFLECGPNAQWGWIEHETGLPIADAIADMLVRTVA